MSTEGKNIASAGVSRRSFLMGLGATAAVVAGSGLAGCAPQSTAAPASAESGSDAAGANSTSSATNAQKPATIQAAAETPAEQQEPKAVAFVIVALVCYFLIACLIPSSTGLAAATMGIMAALSQFAGVDVAIMVTIYCMALGLAKMISPTSIVVMTCTSAAHMSYGDWVKRAAPIVGFLFLVCCVFLTVAVML